MVINGFQHTLTVVRIGSRRRRRCKLCAGLDYTVLTRYTKICRTFSQ